MLPYLEESKKLKSYLKIIKKEYAGYTNEKGVLINDSIEEYTSYILQVVKKFPHHPRYFALGKIDIGNVSLSDQKKLLRGTATCTITLWDLDHGIIPVKIATTPVCRAEATQPHQTEERHKKKQQRKRPLSLAKKY